MRRSQICYWTLTITALINAPCADAAIIDDASFFDSIPHTFVDFETRDDGTPLNLESGDIIFAPLDEYIEVGFVASGMTIAWVYDTSQDVQDALSIGGSTTNDLFLFRFAPNESFGFTFVEDQHSVGFFVVMNNSVGATPPTMTAVARNGEVIDTVTFADGAVDGSIGVIDYGYIGITSDIGIGGILFDSDFAFAIDDFRFSSVLAPGSALFMVPLLTVLIRRRRA